MRKGIGTVCCWLLLLVCTLAQAQPADKILLLGDSLGASYGVAQNRGWAYLLNQKFQQQNLNLHLVNASISGDTTAGGLARLELLLQQEKPRWVMIELGGNDGLRGMSLQAMKQNLEAMIKLTRDYHAQPLLIGIMIPPNYGTKYRDRFDQVYVDVSQSENVPLLPFLLKDVGGVNGLMQADRIHPNAKGQPLIVENVWKFLAPVLDKAITQNQH